MSAARRAAALAVLAAGALGGGCGGAEDQAAAPPATATAAATRTATPTPPPSREVRFRASDGEPVTAIYTAAGDDAPAVVLLHEIRGGPIQWDGLVPSLHDAGYATLAYDSRGSPFERERVADTLGAVRWLRARHDVDRRRLALVGASIGASTAVLAMATGARRTVDAAVALSPVDTPDVWKLQRADRYRPHDLLLISDAAEAGAAESLAEGAVRSKTMRSAGPGHGIDLLSEPAVRRALLGWLDERVG